MTTSWIAVLAILWQPSPAHAAKPPTPSVQVCDFYIDLEKLRHCSEAKENEATYLTLFGHKYCARFKLAREQWKDANLKQWASQTGLCLQEMLADNPKRTIPCDQLEEFAFASHPICYRQYGFCSRLSTWQRVQVLKEIAVLDVLSMPARSLSALVSTMLPCGPSKSDLGFIHFLRHVGQDKSEAERTELAKLVEFIPETEADRDVYYSRVAQNLIVGGMGPAQKEVADAYRANVSAFYRNSRFPATMEAQALKLDASRVIFSNPKVADLELTDKEIQSLYRAFQEVPTDRRVRETVAGARK